MRIGLVKTAKIKSVSAVWVVRLGEHVTDVVCSKQDLVSLSAPGSEFSAMSSGGAHGIHTKNIVSDLQIDVSVRLEYRFDQHIWQTKLQPRTSNWDVCQVRTMKQIQVRNTWNEIVSRSV